jgi:serine-type D-Ala-D-Ala carboxypeptidase/endopeptidase
MDPLFASRGEACLGEVRIFALAIGVRPWQAGGDKPSLIESAMTPRANSLAASLALVLAGAPASARAGDIVLKDAASMSGAILWLSSGAPGLVLAVVRGDESVVLGYGETRPGSKVEPDGRSILRMGSIAKVMAGHVLASMAADGTVKLVHPLAKYAPAGVKVPAFAGREITLLDLATYTAGLPRELPDVPDPKPGENPFAHFEADAYWRWLAQATLPYAPGSGAMYSNLGFGLLGEALAKAGGKPYAALLGERVTTPLGMVDTTTKLSPAQTPRAMTGLDLDGKEAPLWDAPAAMDSSGNVFTTGDDMVKWMRWHLAVNDAAGAEVRVIDHAPYRWHDGLKAAVGVGGEKMDGLGLGWIISMAREKRPLMLTKSGGIAGFMTYVVLAPTRGVGVFVAVNRLNFPMFEGLTSAAHDLVADLAPR